MQTLHGNAKPEQGSVSNRQGKAEPSKTKVTDLLARADALLKKDKVVSAVLNFQPHTLLTVQKAFDHSTWGMIKSSVRGATIVRPDVGSVNGGRVHQESHNAARQAHKEDSAYENHRFENRDSLGIALNPYLDVTYPRNRPIGFANDESGISLGSGDIRHGVSVLDEEVIDLGTNILVTYFLHALEILRLVQVNKELVQDSAEMDSEIETLQQQIHGLNPAQAQTPNITLEHTLLESRQYNANVKHQTTSSSDSSSAATESSISIEVETEVLPEQNQILTETSKVVQNLVWEHEKEIAEIKTKLEQEAIQKQKVLELQIKDLKAQLQALNFPNLTENPQLAPITQPQFSVQIASQHYGTQTMGMSSESEQDSVPSVPEKVQPAQTRVPPGVLNLSSLDRIVASQFHGAILRLPEAAPSPVSANMVRSKHPIEVSYSNNPSSSATVLAMPVQEAITVFNTENPVVISRPTVPNPSPRPSISKAEQIIYPAANTYKPMLGRSLGRNSSTKTLQLGQEDISGRSSYAPGQARIPGVDSARDPRYNTEASTFGEAIRSVRPDVEYSVYQPPKVEFFDSQRGSISSGAPQPQQVASASKRQTQPSTPADLVQQLFSGPNGDRSISVSGSVDKPYVPSSFSYRSHHMANQGGLAPEATYSPAAVFSDLKQHLKNFGNAKQRHESMSQTSSSVAYQVVQNAAKHTPLQAPIGNTVSSYFQRERQQLSLIKPNQDRSITGGPAQFIQSTNQLNARIAVPASPIALRGSQPQNPSNATLQKPGTSNGVPAGAYQPATKPTTSFRFDQANPIYSFKSPTNPGLPLTKGTLNLRPNTQPSPSYSNYLNNTQAYLLKK